MTYANGRVLDYVYGSGLDDAISRLTSLTGNSTTLESLSYLGLGTVVKRGKKTSMRTFVLAGRPETVRVRFAL